MNRWYLLLILIPVLVFFLTPTDAYKTPPAPAPIPPAPTDLRFVENQGQWEEEVLYNVRLRGGHIVMESGGLRYIFVDYPESAKGHGAKIFGAGKLGLRDSMIRGHVVKMRFLNGNPSPEVFPSFPFPEHYNYYRGEDPSRWADHVKPYRQLDYSAVYPGIDFRMYGDGDHAKYDFIVAPGAEPSLIQLGYEGADNMWLDDEGNLQIKTSIRDITELRPVAWQMDEGVHKEVPIRFALDEEVLSFEFPQGYDKSLPLIIDPALIFSSYTGSFDDNWGFTATYDNDGKLYAGGIIFDQQPGSLTGSSGFPDQPGAFQRSFQGGISDVVLARFNAAGTAFEWATYLGGSQQEQPQSLIANDNGELFVYGRTNSGNFPTTPGAYGRLPEGDNDIFIARINNSGGLVASTRIGGRGSDGENGESVYPSATQAAPPIQFNYGDHARGEIILDRNGDILVAACTQSSDFPTTSNAPRRNLGGSQDGVVFRMSSNLQNLLWSTYLGGNGWDAAFGIKEDFSGNVLVTGGTTSNDLSVPNNPLYGSYQGGPADGFIMKYNSGGNNLLAGTYIGTNRYDQSYFIEVDTSNNVYVTGQTSGNYPVVGNVYSNNGARQFITKLDNNLHRIIYSTRFGQANAANINISPTAFLVDRCENVYVAGWGGSTNNSTGAHHYGAANGLLGATVGMPLRDALQTTTDGSDFYIIVIERDARNLLFGSYMGGNNLSGFGEHVDGGTCRFDPEGIIYHAVCAGCGGFSNFPTTPGVAGPRNNSQNCNLAAFKIELELAGIKASFRPLDQQNQPLEVRGCPPLFVRFDNQTSNDGPGTIYNWDFGNRSTSNQGSPSASFSNPGTYRVKLVAIDSSTCNIVDSAIRTIIVFDEPEVDAGPDEIICDGERVTLRATSNSSNNSYSWGPQTGISGPRNLDSVVVFPPTDQSYIVVVQDSNGCVSSDTVNVLIDQTLEVGVREDTVICRGAIAPLSGTTNGTSFTWSPDATINDPNSLNTFVAPDTTTTYVLSVVSQRGCELEDSVEIEVFEVFTLEDTSLCRGDTLLLATSNGVNFTWSPNVSIDDTTLASPRIWPDQTITYTVEARSNAGCFSTKDVLVVVNGRPTATVGPMDSACFGDTTRVSAGGGVNYLWSPAEDMSNPFSANSLVYPDTTTMYQVIVFDENRCRDTAEVEVTIHPLPVLVIISDDTICEGEPLFLEVTGAQTYLWEPDTTLSDLTIPNPIATPLEPTTYYVTGTDQFGCESDTSISIEIVTRPEVEIDGDNFLCVGETILLTAEGGDNVLWSTNETSNTISVIPNGPTLYYVTAFNGTCEGETDSIIVDEFFEYPVAEFEILPGPNGFAPQVTDFINLSEGAESYFWDFGFNNRTSTLRDPQEEFPYPQQYEVMLIAFSNTGCPDTLTKTINLENYALHVPTGFTPNGDNTNDFWYVGHYGIRTLQVELYNRWGTLIYTANDKDFRWDGTYNGQHVPEGVFVWVINAVSENNITLKRKGTVTLVR
jgi:gliding motility-associated-like protein